MRCHDEPIEWHAGHNVDHSRSSLPRMLFQADVVGLVVSLGARAFLTLVPLIQDLFHAELPDALALAVAPWRWPMPILVAASGHTAPAIVRMPGQGGGVPANGPATALTEPNTLPAILLAALATIGFGLVLGPASPVIALGTGLGLLVVRRAANSATDEAHSIVATTGGFAALALTTSCSSAAEARQSEILATSSPRHGHRVAPFQPILARHRKPVASLLRYPRDTARADQRPRAPRASRYR